MVKRLIGGVSILLFMAACQDFVHEEKIIDDYFLIAIDEEPQMSVSYSVNEDNSSFVGVIDQTVYAMGNNQDFIIVKQHPRNWPNPSDKSITNYFIIPLKNKVSKSVEKNIIGSMSKEEFERKRVELDIPESLTFTKVFKDLE